MIKIFFTIFLSIYIVVSCFTLSAQTWLWAKDFGSVQEDRGNAITGNGEKVFVAGSFSDKFSMDAFNVSSHGGKDIFVARYDYNGNTEWFETASGSSDNSANTISLDNLGGLFVGGYYTDTLRSGNLHYTGHSTKNGFISRWGQNGSMIWLRKVAGNGLNEVLAMSVAEDNSVFATGYFSETAAFETDQKTAQGGSDIFVAKYSVTGNLQWVNHFGGTASDKGKDIVTDNLGNTYVVGYFTGEAAFGNIELKAGGMRKGFLIKLDADGNVIWANAINGDGNSSITTVQHLSDKVFIAGTFTDSFQFNQQTYHAFNGTNAFILCYDTKGDEVWAKVILSQNDISINSMQLDDDKVYLSGDYRINISIPGDYFYNSGTLHSSFITTFTTDGDFTEMYHAGGNNAICMKGIYVEDEQTIFSTGYFSQNVNFGSHSLSTSGNKDIFIARFGTNIISSFDFIEENDKESDFLFHKTGSEYRISYLNSSDFEPFILQLYDLQGRKIFQSQFSQQLEFNLHTIPKGVYLIVVTNSNRIVYNEKFLH